MTEDVAGIRAGVEQSAAGIASFTEYIEQQHARRRLQHEEQCRGAGMQTMLATCCPDGGGGHRRELQGSGRGCTAFPDTCSAACAQPITSIAERANA